MYSPPRATPLSLLLSLSALLTGFWATETSAADTLFIKRPHSTDLPPALVYCPGERPTGLAEVLKSRAKGKPVLLHLWAPFCKPCHEEMRQIEAEHQRLSAEGLEVLTLAEDPQGPVSVPAFARRHTIIHLDLCYDQASTTLTYLQEDGALPATYLVSPEGKILAHHKGSLDWATLSLK